MSSCDGEIFIRREMFTKIGRKNATRGVLFMKAERAATGASSRRRAR